MTSATRAREHAAQVRKEQQDAQARLARRKRLGIVVAVLVVAALIGVIVQSARTDSGGAMATPVGAVEDGGLAIGSASAPVLLEVYEDFQCPACARFEASNRAQVRQWVDSGKVRVEYHLLSFLGPESVRAANAAAAAMAAGDEKFLAFHDSLYENQPAEHSGGYSNKDLIATAKSVGITGSEFEQSVNDSTYNKWVADVQDKSSKRGVVATPTIFLDGKQLDSAQLDPQTFTKLVEDAAKS